MGVFERAGQSRFFGAQASCPHCNHGGYACNLCSGISTACRADTSTQNAMAHVNLRAGCPRSRKSSDLDWRISNAHAARMDCLSAPGLSGIIHPAVQTDGRACQPVSFHGLGHRRRRNTRNRSGIKNHWDRQIWRASDWDLWKHPKPATEGARNASCNLSGTKDRWGAARFRAAPFLFPKFFTGSSCLNELR